MTASATPAAGPPAAATPAAAAPAAKTVCAATMLNVMVNRPGATNDSTLRAIARELIAPVRGFITQVDVSPAIRTFRIHLADPASVDRVTKQLRAAAGVERVSLDDCTMRVQRPSSSPPASPR